MGVPDVGEGKQPRGDSINGSAQGVSLSTGLGVPGSLMWPNPLLVIRYQA